MLVYTVVARDPTSGQNVSSEVEAVDERTAANLITQKGLLPLEIKIKDQGRRPLPFLSSSRVKAKDKVLFSRQLASLLAAGIPLVQSLRMVADQIKSKAFKTVISNIATDIESGSSFSNALGRYPQLFDQAYRGVIAAGETTGGIAKSMTRLADQQERDVETISKIRGALIYPAVVIVVIIAVATFMIVKVLPQVELLYKGFPGATLPLFTRILLAISSFVTDFWWLLVLFLAVLIFFTFRWSRTAVGQRFWDRVKLNAPPLNKLFRKLYMARFSLNLGVLLDSGVPLLQALEITAQAVGNILVAGSIARASEQVRGGRALSESLAGDANFMDLVPSMLQIGEKSGTVAAMMLKTADYYQQELDNEIKNITTVLEPALMIIVGILALILVAAILLPIYGLVGKIS